MATFFKDTIKPSILLPMTTDSCYTVSLGLLIGLLRSITNFKCRKSGWFYVIIKGNALFVVWKHFLRLVTVWVYSLMSNTRRLGNCQNKVSTDVWRLSLVLSLHNQLCYLCYKFSGLCQRWTKIWKCIFTRDLYLLGFPSWLSNHRIIAGAFESWSTVW